MNSEYYRLINPKDYNNIFIKENCRVDGRAFMESRFLKIGLAAHENTHGSADVALGSTKVFCGIRAEPMDKKPGEDILDFISIQVNFPFVNTQNLRTNQMLEQSQIAIYVMQNYVRSFKILMPEDLTDCDEKLFWSLSCELICLADDGSFYDACALALLAALRNVKLPIATAGKDAVGYKLDEKERRPLNLRANPISVTFSTWNKDMLMVDPTKEEEENGEGTVTIIYDVDSGRFNITKTGCCILETEITDKCLSEAEERSKMILEQIQKQ